MNSNTTPVGRVFFVFFFATVYSTLTKTLFYSAGYEYSKFVILVRVIKVTC